MPSYTNREELRMQGGLIWFCDVLKRLMMSLWFESEMSLIDPHFEYPVPSLWPYFEGCRVFKQWGLASRSRSLGTDL